MRNRWAIGLLIIAMFMQVGWAFAQDSETPTEEEPVVAEETATAEPIEVEPAVEATEVQGTQYIVQPGDNLFRIALRFNVPLSQLAAANGITNPALIYVGQVLIIPGTEPVAPPEEPTEEVTEEPTEEVTEEPTEEVTEEPTEEVTEEPTEEVTEEPTEDPTEEPQPPTETYQVQRGDTLYTIAVRFGTTVSQLVNLNNLANANVIYSGQVLRVPAAGSAPATPVPAPTEASVATEEPTEVPSEETTPEPTAEPVMMEPGIEVFITGEDVSALVSQAQQVGVEWVKITINWRDVETEQGNLNLADIDAAIDAFNAAEISILLQLTSAPDWARPSASEFVLASSEYGPPDDLSLFGTFATSIATRYGSKVQAYQIWNEPNLRRNWIDAATTDRSNAKLSGIGYIDLLSTAYEAIKSANPSALVISAGLAPTGLNDGVNAFDDRQYLQGLLANGLADVSDGVGVHPDGFANPPDARSPEQAPGVDTHFDSPRFFFLDTLDEYHTILENAGDSDPLWVTRFGWGTAEGNALVQPNEFNIFLTYTSPQEQALYTVRAFELGSELGHVGPMILFNLNGCAAGLPEACYYSLVDSSVSARPVFNSLENVQTVESGE